MRARDPGAAARSAVPILLVCAVTLIVFTGFGPNSVSSRAITASWLVAVGLAGLAAGYWLGPARPTGSTAAAGSCSSR